MIEIENLEKILKDPENIIYEQISELKRQVDLDREILKSQIDTLADGLIQQLESYEKEFKAEYKTNIDLEKYNRVIESSRSQLNEFEKYLNLFSVENNERDKKTTEIKKAIHFLQTEIVEIKNELFSNLAIKYQPKEEKRDELFGKLITKVS
jgi:predicted site-specific integrase-resolvase